MLYNTKSGMENLRKIRAYSILAKGVTPKMVDKETYYVPSQTDPDKRYRVENHDMWSCTCPDFTENSQNGHPMRCKHITCVQIWTQLRETLMDGDILELGEKLIEQQVRCTCGSFHVIKHGVRKTKQGRRQRYLCHTCKKTFVADPVKGHNGDGRLITLCMDLFYKGLSLRKIADTIYQFYGLEIHHETVRRWINASMEKINQYVKNLEPNVSDIWHTDEQKIKTKKDGWVWSWNTIDNGTRFLIANNVTMGRSTLEARQIFNKAKRIAGGKPHYMVTDGLQSYHDAFNKELYDHHRTCKHISGAGIRKRSNNNNMVERFHSTVRERDKVMRCLHDMKTTTQMLDNYRTYYNFIRPHSALNLRTPSEIAGVNLNLGNNRWMGLLNKAL